MVTIVCGSLGWDHPSLLQSFYPEDLPEDWRLTYYANEFSAVLLPRACWVGVSLEQLRVWRDDVSESFRFFFLIDGQCPDVQLDLLRQGLGCCFGGVVKAPQKMGLDICVLPLQDSGSGDVVISTFYFGDKPERPSAWTRFC